jgi:hypothetical protein
MPVEGGTKLEAARGHGEKADEEEGGHQSQRLPVNWKGGRALDSTLNDRNELVDLQGR